MTVASNVSPMRAAPLSNPAEPSASAATSPSAAPVGIGFAPEPVIQKTLLGAAQVLRPLPAPVAADTTKRTIAGWSDLVRDRLVELDEAKSSGRSTARAIVNLRIAVQGAEDAFAKAGRETPIGDLEILTETVKTATKTLEAHRAHTEARVEIAKIARAFQAQLDGRPEPARNQDDQINWENATWAFFETWKPRLAEIAPNLTESAETQLSNAVGTQQGESTAAVLRAVISGLDAMQTPHAKAKKPLK